MDAWQIGEPCGDCGCTAFIKSPAGTLHAHLADCPQVSLRERVEALERELGYAIDALEGKPWTGWNTDTARAVLGGQ
jgi:hypothetical protein